MSGLKTEEMGIELSEQGVNGYFPKPIEWDDLIAFLDAFNYEEPCSTDQHENAIKNG